MIVLNFVKILRENILPEKCMKNIHHFGERYWMLLRICLIKVNMKYNLYE